MDNHLPPPIAAVVPNGVEDADEVVAGFAIAQINRGRRVRGLVQEVQQTQRTKRITLVNLDDGRIYPITQELGTHAMSCRLNPCAIAEASVVMRGIALRGAELAIFNRYSTLEAKGRGFFAEMLDLMAQGIPVLTIVPRQHLETWRKVTGGWSSELEPSRSALEKWFDDILQRLPPDTSPSIPT